MRERSAGAAFALTAGCLLVVTLLLLKGLVRELPAIVVVGYVYTFAAMWHALYSLARGARLPRLRTVAAGGLLGVLDGVYNIALLTGLSLMGSAAHGFYALLGDLCAITLGIVILRERYTRREIAGWVTVIAGAAIIRAHGGGAGAGAPWMMLAAVASGTSAALIRYLTRTHAPSELMLTRTACVAVALGAGYAWWSDVPAGALLRLAVVGLLGPFLAALCSANAYRRLEVGHVVSVRMIYAVLLPFGAWVVYAQPPALRELVGGALMVAGCMVMIRSRA